MEALELLNDLENQGLRLAVKRDRLLVMHSRRITENTRSLIRRHKTNLLCLIRPKAATAQQIKTLRSLFHSPGIKAGDLLLTINPRPETYLGLPRDPVTKLDQLRKFTNGLEKALNNENLLNHHALSLQERKEMTLLAMALVPKDWTLEIKRMLLIIHPPAIADDVRQQLVRKWKSDFARRQIEDFRRSNRRKHSDNAASFFE